VSGLAKAPISSITNVQMTISQTGRSEKIGLGGQAISAEYEIGRAAVMVSSCWVGKYLDATFVHKIG
jgi:hypothetical protein